MMPQSRTPTRAANARLVARFSSMPASYRAAHAKTAQVARAGRSLAAINIEAWPSGSDTYGNGT